VEKLFKLFIVIILTVMNLISCKNEKQVDKSNPFFSEFNTPFNVPAFEKIMAKHYMPAFEKGMSRRKK
jgi:peptidyl-dipeptidase Dcp